MAERQCSACGAAAKYLRPETGYQCKACRAEPEQQVCRQCDATFTGRKRKYCNPRCAKRASDRRSRQTPAGRERRKRRHARDKDRYATDSAYREQVKERDRRRTNERRLALQRERRKHIRHRYLAARRSDQRYGVSGYSGSLEEYAEYLERKLLGCRGSDWSAWMLPAPPDPELVAAREAREAWRHWIHERAPDWWMRRYYEAKGKPWNNPRLSSAEKFTMRYELDAEFAQQQRDRQRLKKFMNPSYAARHDTGARWRRAFEQLGKLTRAHLKREMRAPRCSYCLGQLTADNRQLDHIVPISSGGEHADDNIIAVCRTCNVSKGRKSLVMWLHVTGG